MKHQARRQQTDTYCTAGELHKSVSLSVYTAVTESFRFFPCCDYEVTVRCRRHWCKDLTVVVVVGSS